MEIDEELVDRMRRIAQREAEVAKEKEEVRHFARQELSQLEKQIDDIREQLEILEIKRDGLMDFLGVRSQINETSRLAHGALKELCFEALKGNIEGLRSADVKAWIEKHHPDVRVASVPATLSRQMENGALIRDQLGRYRLPNL